MLDTIIQLMGWYGIDNDPVALIDYDATFAAMPTFGRDGVTELHTVEKGYHARQRMLGMSLSREVPVSVAFLGGVRPVVRLEGAYFFDNTYMDFDQTQYYEKDELRWGIGFDWKVKINWLNSKAYFVLYPEYVYHEIQDVDKETFIDPFGAPAVKRPILMNENLHSKTEYWNLYIGTSYWHTKILPYVFYQYETKSESHFLLGGITYERDNHWNFTIQAVAFHGDDSDFKSASKGFNNKDNFSFTTSYRF